MSLSRSSAVFVFISLALLSCGNPGGPAGSSTIYMPPDQFLYPFPGTITISDLSDNGAASQEVASSQVISSAALNFNICRIQLPSADKIDRKFRKCLFLVGLAGCNGAYNVDADPQRRVIPPGYERTCSEYWSDVYDRLKPNPETGRD